MLNTDGRDATPHSNISLVLEQSVLLALRHVGVLHKPTLYYVENNTLKTLTSVKTTLVKIYFYNPHKI